MPLPLSCVHSKYALGPESKHNALCDQNIIPVSAEKNTNSRGMLLEAITHSKRAIDYSNQVVS